MRVVPDILFNKKPSSVQRGRVACLITHSKAETDRPGEALRVEHPDSEPPVSPSRTARLSPGAEASPGVLS